MAAVDTPLWSPYTIATVVHVTLQITASLTSRRYPLILVVVYVLCGIKVAFWSEYTLAWLIKWYMVVFLGGIPALCCSLPKLRSPVVRGRSCIGHAFVLIVILNITFLLLTGLNTTYERLQGLCSVLLCIWMIVRVATLARQGRPCFDVTTAGMPITLFTPMRWVCSYYVWMTLLSWPRQGLTFTLHILVLPIFMISLVKLENDGELEDAGYYFGFARAVSLSTYDCEKGFLQGPPIDSIKEFEFPEDIGGVLLGFACLNALYLLINLAYAFHGLWSAHAHNVERCSEKGCGTSTDKALPSAINEERRTSV